MMSDKIAPCLWFDGRAEEAARLYASLLPDSRVDAVHRAAADYPSGRKGDVLTVEFTLAGRKFVGLNGGPHFTFNEAVRLAARWPSARLGSIEVRPIEETLPEDRRYHGSER